jgi:hypothetical protein
VNRDWSLKPFLIHASKTKKGQRSLSALLVTAPYLVGELLPLPFPDGLLVVLGPLVGRHPFAIMVLCMDDAGEFRMPASASCVLWTSE